MTSTASSIEPRNESSPDAAAASKPVVLTGITGRLKIKGMVEEHRSRGFNKNSKKIASRRPEDMPASGLPTANYGKTFRYMNGCVPGSNGFHKLDSSRSTLLNSTSAVPSSSRSKQFMLGLSATHRESQ